MRQDGPNLVTSSYMNLHVGNQTQIEYLKSTISGFGPCNAPKPMVHMSDGSENCTFSSSDRVLSNETRRTKFGYVQLYELTCRKLDPKSINQIRYSDRKIFRSSYIQIVRYSDRKIFRSSDIQIVRYSDSQIFRQSDIEMLRYRNGKIFQIKKSINTKESNRVRAFCRPVYATT